MTWIAVGSAAIVTAGTIYSSNKASKSADKAAAAAAAADDKRLAFAREQYDEWQATYGPTEDNLAAYYNTLSPTLRTVQGLEAFEKEKNIALTNMRENLAQRGIATSGIAAQQETEVALASAGERARIRATAPMEVAKEQLGFLSVGLGLSPAAGVNDALSDAQRNANRIAEATAKNAGTARGAAVSALTDLAQEGWEAYRTRKREPWDESIPGDN